MKTTSYFQIGDRVERIGTANEPTRIGDTGVILAIDPFDPNFPATSAPIKVKWDHSLTTNNNLPEFLEHIDTREEGQGEYTSSIYTDRATLAYAVTTYLADTERNSGYNHFYHLLDAGFWDEPNLEGAINILGQYINDADFCAKGRERAMSHFGIERVVTWVQAQVQVNDLCRSSEEFFWDKGHSAVTGFQILNIPLNVELPVWKRG